MLRYIRINSTFFFVVWISLIKSVLAQGSDDGAIKLIIIIVVPTVGITLICIVCVVVGIRKTKRSGQKWWKIYENAARAESAVDVNTIDNKIPYSLAAQMNHYMDIKAMAEQFKKDKWEIVPKNLMVQDDCLGNGAFACVYRGTLKGTVPLFKVYSSLKLVLEHRTNENCEVAVKKLPAHANHEGRVDFFHEMAFMKQLGYHPHVISMLGCVSNPIEPLIVVEYCKHGDLLRFLRKHKNTIFTEENVDCPIDAEICLKIKELVSIAWQVSDGMCYLISHKFIHRDLAARNILLTKSLCAKISDFGLCRYADSALYTAKGGRLPIKWMAPESLTYYEYSEKSEVWSFGILLWEIFSMGEAPFPAVQPTEMREHLEEGNRMRQPVKCPNEIYELMCKCWQYDAENRPKFEEVRNHLTTLLNLGDEQYGYVSLSEQGPQPGATHLTYLTDECPLTPEMLGTVVEVIDEGNDSSEVSSVVPSASVVTTPRTSRSDSDPKQPEIRNPRKKQWKKMLDKPILLDLELDAKTDRVTLDRSVLMRMHEITSQCEDIKINIRSRPTSPTGSIDEDGNRKGDTCPYAWTPSVSVFHDGSEADLQKESPSDEDIKRRRARKASAMLGTTVLSKLPSGNESDDESDGTVKHSETEESPEEEIAKRMDIRNVRVSTDSLDSFTV